MSGLRWRTLLRRLDWCVVTPLRWHEDRSVTIAVLVRRWHPGFWLYCLRGGK